MNVRHTLGIMTCQTRPPYAEHLFFREISRRAAAYGLSVFVFSPRAWQPAQQWGRGYAWSEERRAWKPIRVPLPDLVYDRCFFLSSAHYRAVAPAIRQLQRHPSVRFLGHGLAGKWEVYTILSRHPDIRPYLPETARVVHPREIRAHLQQKGDVVIKPLGGSLGRKVIRIRKRPAGTVILSGRDGYNHPFSTTVLESQLDDRLRRLLATSRWLVQAYLHWYDDGRRPFDIRILAQKNGQGEWEVVGKAIRQGLVGGLTANLHGGGHGIGFHRFMQRHFPDKAASIERQIDELSRLIPPFLESHHGPLVELGIDIGVDKNGNVWVIEVNSKPGRTLFSWTGERDVQERSVQNIVDYACYLLKAKDWKARENHRHENIRRSHHHLATRRPIHLVTG